MSQSDPPPDSPVPAVRASDAEREAAVSQLRTAAGEGRLSLDELAERLERALTAVTRADLEPLTRDLPVADAAAAGAPAAAADAPAAATSPGATPRGAEGRRWLIGIMGGGTQRGRWRIAKRCSVINVMGGADLDLTEAIVDDTEIEIRVFSLMGGSDILVPDGVTVELTGFALMGGNDLKLEGSEAGPGAPVVRVRAYSVMGGTDVKRARRHAP